MNTKKLATEILERLDGEINNQLSEDYEGNKRESKKRWNHYINTIKDVLDEYVIPINKNENY